MYPRHGPLSGLYTTHTLCHSEVETNECIRILALRGPETLVLCPVFRLNLRLYWTSVGRPPPNARVNDNKIQIVEAQLTLRSRRPSGLNALSTISVIAF